MVLSLEQHRYHIRIYARSVHIVSEELHALLHRYKYQLAAILLIFQNQQMLHCYSDRYNVR